MQTIGMRSARERRHGLAVHRLIRLAEVLPPLGVADDDVLGACLAHHRGADLTGERALLFPEHVLRGDRDGRVPGRLRHRMHSEKRRRHDDVDAGRRL